MKASDKTHFCPWKNHQPCPVMRLANSVNGDAPGCESAPSTWSGLVSGAKRVGSEGTEEGRSAVGDGLEFLEVVFVSLSSSWATEEESSYNSQNEIHDCKNRIINLPWAVELVGWELVSFMATFTPMDMRSTFISITSGEPRTSLLTIDLSPTALEEDPTWT